MLTGKPKIVVENWKTVTLDEPIMRRQSCEIQERMAGETLNDKTFREMMEKTRVKMGFDFESLPTEKLIELFQLFNFERNEKDLTLYPHDGDSANFKIVSEGDIIFSPYHDKQILGYWKISLNFESKSLEGAYILNP